jgi:hypothetical protein
MFESNRGRVRWAVWFLLGLLYAMMAALALPIVAP